MVASGEVHVESTDIGCSDHFLVWMELGRVAKCSTRDRHVIRKWRLDRFDDEEVNRRYQNALKSLVSGFVECVSRKEYAGITGMELVDEVFMEWERVVNRVAKVEVGKKMIVCGRAARWWDGEIRDKISLRREVYRKMVSGQKELWSEYCRLCKEVKDLVRQKKISIWNEVIEWANADFEGSRKEFWALVSRRSKEKKNNIASLKNESRISVTSTQGKLQILQSHYERLVR